MNTAALRRIRITALAAGVTMLSCAAAWADEAVPAGPLASTPAVEVWRDAGGLHAPALRLHLAQTLGPDAARESHRHRQTVFGQDVDMAVPFASQVAGPRFAPANPHDSSTFERSRITGQIGLLNVAWLGLQRLNTP